MSVQSKKVWAPGPGRAAPTTQTGDAFRVDRLTRAIDVGEPLQERLSRSRSLFHHVLGDRPLGHVSWIVGVGPHCRGLSDQIDDAFELALSADR